MKEQKVGINSGKEFEVGKISSSLFYNIMNNQTDDKSLGGSIRFYPFHDNSRGVTKVVFEFTTKTSPDPRSIWYVLPHVNSGYLGVFDNGKLVAALYNNPDLGDHGEYVIRDFSGANLERNPPEMEKYISRILNLLQNQEYSLFELEKRGDEFVYDLDALKSKVDEISLCKNNEGKACAYAEIFPRYASYVVSYLKEMENREDWRTLTLHDEVKDAVEFVEDKKDEGVTVVKFKAPDNRVFYVRLPLIEKNKACLVSSGLAGHGIEYIISRDEENKLKLNVVNPIHATASTGVSYYYSMFCTFLLGDIYRCKIQDDLGFASIKYTTGTKTEDGKQIILDDLKDKLIDITETPDKNPRLERFVKSLITDNFVRNGSNKSYELLYKIITNNGKNTLEDHEVIESLKTSGAINLEERTNRGWGRFVIDLFYHIASYFTGNSLGNLTGKGIITIEKEDELVKKLEKLMTAKDSSKDAAIGR